MDLKAEDLKPIVGVDLDIERFEGVRAEIERLDIVDTKTNYNEAGVYVEGLQRNNKMLKISTKILDRIDVPGKEPIELRASMMFGLREQKDKDGNTFWGYSMGKNSKLAKFLKLMKVGAVGELKGKMVTVLTRPNADGSRTYLGYKVE